VSGGTFPQPREKRQKKFLHHEIRPFTNLRDARFSDASRARFLIDALNERDFFFRSKKRKKKSVV